MSRETRWCLGFDNCRRGLVTRNDVEAPSPATAVAAGREAGHWILYRITRLTLLLLAASGIAFADVPRPQDIAACNEEAKDVMRKGKDSRGASPTADDHRRAADARQGGTLADTAGSARASNPQLDGMDPARAGDPAYQAAYRACMRKAGF